MSSDKPEESGIPSSWGVETKFKNLVDYLTSPHLNPGQFTIRNSDALFLLWNAVNDDKLAEYLMDKMVEDHG